MKKFKNICAVLLVVLSLGLLVGCGKSNEVSEEPPVVEPPEKLPIVTITIKDYGVIKAELYPHYAPNTVNNFISLVDKKFYDGLTFHRIIENFMIQAGCPEGNGTGGPGYYIKGEFAKNKFTQNTLLHEEGILSMARSSRGNDTAGSQFFIMASKHTNLDRDYAAFGKVIEGLDVVHAIETVDTDSNDAPKEKVVIESITVDTQGVEYPEPEKM